ncbi:biotin carboxylase N-terminal domain-containing protein [Erythrobacter sp.]|uniref:acetyl-CoA carboxylase biotin carboxylase subunit n=1 Tax=Erythrobacter sp. TaxID=1042 RepID=UPI001B229DF7|nr:biotin carboxylase N-terminal domain-containing protein [Erythrobacter sp.]MBO6525427.1 ATP-grasp domain-containing protein [Erythrobacter sp.]MBO6529900.1 ATP-grasp domain-containing protein [Erythrobacter sp.]
MSRLFVANRGEIACRIIAAAKSLGVETVVGVSEADKNSLWAKAADRVLVLGPAPAQRSYLDGNLIVHAALASGCDALHPGYGFLSENAGFARTVIDSGLAFCGPTPDQMEAVGDKISARKLAQDLGVETGQASEAVTDNSAAQMAARTLGYPVVTKASAGGGGRGMRVVHKQADLATALAGAQAEAEAAFGDGRIYLEPFVEAARHVEVQAFGLGNGEVITLGTRDCSIQRRYQKLVEEAPAVAVPEAARKEMEAAASRLLGAISYRGAGTVEFLWDEARQQSRFLEVNARIQVEHPVTEMICGIDLVQWQIALAFNRFEPPSSLMPSGHAIEVRILAEDEDFRPSPGRITAWTPPSGGRVDTGFATGCDVPPYYDSMVAKLIVAATSRPEAVDRLQHGLSEFEVEGIDTSIPFLRKLAAHSDFASNQLSTRWLESHFLSAGTSAA